VRACVWRPRAPRARGVEAAAGRDATRVVLVLVALVAPVVCHWVCNGQICIR
jgi:hypothetical protein